MGSADFGSSVEGVTGVGSEGVTGWSGGVTGCSGGVGTGAASTEKLTPSATVSVSRLSGVAPTEYVPLANVCFAAAE